MSWQSSRAMCASRRSSPARPATRTLSFTWPGKWPCQFGIDDQGWLAFFAICAATGRPFTIYGDGKQVRDLLYIDDLARAFEAAVAHIDRAAGRVYNIGGGQARTLSVWAETRPVL